ncbi:MAG: dihydroorotate dehydrogenase electron transfer subunit [Acidobacteria bacterium]|nr:MAG: dihydroorotate dehydrogenase electron transfer subunit [Acidobacteriota bacterium]
MRENRSVEVVAQEALGGDCHLMRLRWPELARSARAGQFVMIGLPDLGAMLLRRPFSVARVGSEAGGPATFEILYKVFGRATAAFSRLRPGARLAVLGPLGRGFWTPDGAGAGSRALLVAGGIGVAPFPLLLQQLGPRAASATLLYGGRSRADLPLLDWFSSRCRVVPVTEDGSCGRRGLVTDALADELERGGEAVVYACGPAPMLKAAAELCLERNVPCQLALEEMMACGFGVCLGCVVERRRPATPFERYARVCTEGPVFDAREVAL